jgi:hypothetical protein
VTNSVRELRQFTGVSQRASAWAYFVLHAIDFVKTGGRLAMLLPGSVLHADYSTAVRKALNQAFGQVELLRVDERIFTGTREETVVLLAADRVRGDWRKAAPALSPEVRVESVRSVLELEQHLLRWKRSVRLQTITTPDVVMLDGPTYKLEVISKAALEILSVAMANPLVRTLDDVAHVSIGTVTGANHFFVRDRVDIPDEPGVGAVPVVHRSAWLRSPRWTSRAHHDVVRRTGRGHLLVAEPNLSFAQAPRFRRLVVEAEATEINLGSHCSRRSPWWALRDFRPSEILLPYMGAEVPRLVLNDLRAACTNSVHRVFWNEKQSRAKQAGVVASSYTSLFGLSAELSGRHYGGGVLKIEPSKAASLLVIFDVGGEDALGKVEAAFRRGGMRSATKAADEHFRRRLGLTQQQIDSLRATQEALRTLRP